MSAINPESQSNIQPHEALKFTQDPANPRYVNFYGLKGKEYAVRAEKKAERNGFIGKIFAGIKNFVKFSGRYVEVEVDEATKLMVNVSSLAKKLQISKSQIKANAKEHKLTGIIETQCQFLQKIDEIKSNFTFDSKVSKYKHKAPDLPFSLSFTESEFKLYTTAIARIAVTPVIPNDDEGIKAHMIDLKTSCMQVVTPGSEDRRIIALYGKRIGEGGYGQIFQTYNAITGQLVKDSSKIGVFKEPFEVKDMKNIIHSAKMVKAIHEGAAGGRAVGIQDPIHIVTVQGKVDIGCLMPKYDCSLDKMKDSKDHFRDMALQLSEGLATMHAKNLIHGDIKSENILVRKRDNVQQFHLGDFDGVVSLDKNISKVFAMKTPLFCPGEDIEAADVAKKWGELDEVKEIGKKADVYALCSTLYEVVRGKLHFEDWPGSKSFPEFKKSIGVLSDELKGVITDENLRRLIVKGLSQNYKERPTAAEIVWAIREQPF